MIGRFDQVGIFDRRLLRFVVVEHHLDLPISIDFSQARQENGGYFNPIIPSLGERSIST